MLKEVDKWKGQAHFINKSIQLFVFLFNQIQMHPVKDHGWLDHKSAWAWRWWRKCFSVKWSSCCQSHHLHIFTGARKRLISNCLQKSLKIKYYFIRSPDNTVNELNVLLENVFLFLFLSWLLTSTKRKI